MAEGILDQLTEVDPGYPGLSLGPDKGDEITEPVPEVKWVFEVLDI